MNPEIERADVGDTYRMTDQFRRFLGVVGDVDRAMAAWDIARESAPAADTTEPAPSFSAERVPWTAGPWRVAKRAQRRVTSDTGVIICNAVLRNQGGPKHKAYLKDEHEAEANAHLIAAAPDIAKALEKIAAVIDPLMRAVLSHDGRATLIAANDLNTALPAARAALARARGEAQ